MIVVAIVVIVEYSLDFAHLLEIGSHELDTLDKVVYVDLLILTVSTVVTGSDGQQQNVLAS